MSERHKKFLNLEEAVTEIVKDLSSSEPEQVKLFADEIRRVSTEPESGLRELFGRMCFFDS